MSKATVMLLEDDIRASYTLESTINQHPDFNVVTVSESCREALNQFDAFKPELVFVDITLDALLRVPRSTSKPTIKPKNA